MCYGRVPLLRRRQTLKYQRGSRDARRTNVRYSAARKSAPGRDAEIVPAKVQHLRDARILTIDEGTTAIQANDPTTRSVARPFATAVERLARMIATAEHVWDSADDARAFLSVLSESAARGFQEDRCREPGAGGLGYAAVQSTLTASLSAAGRGACAGQTSSVAPRDNGRQDAVKPPLVARAIDAFSFACRTRADGPAQRLWVHTSGRRPTVATQRWSDATMAAPPWSRWACTRCDTKRWTGSCRSDRVTPLGMSWGMPHAELVLSVYRR
jgi:hypothetical protein